MKINLTKKNLKVDGFLCSSVTINKINENKFTVVIFDHEKKVKTKTKKTKWGIMEYKTGRRFTTGTTNIQFLGIKPKVYNNSITEFHKSQGQIWSYAENKKGNYINYYALKPEELRHKNK